jgi:hypothetical protein
MPTSGSVPTVASSAAVKVAEVHLADANKLWKILIPAAVVVVAALVAGGLYFRSHHAAPLTEKDTIVLSDFTNTTGDAIFDDTLKTGAQRFPATIAFLERALRQRSDEDLEVDDPSG